VQREKPHQTSPNQKGSAILPRRPVGERSSEEGFLIGFFSSLAVNDDNRIGAAESGAVNLLCCDEQGWFFAAAIFSA